MSKRFFLLLCILALSTAKRIKDVSKSPLEVQADGHFETVLSRLATFEPQRLDQQQNEEKANGRSLSDHLNDDSASQRKLDESTSKWTIQGNTKPVFECSDCRGELIREQLRILDAIRSKFPSMKILAQTERILNAVYVELPSGVTITAEGLGAKRVLPQSVYTLDVQENAEIIGALEVNDAPYCFKGDGMKVGILDTGIDYTHAALGGPGTLLAYELAYGLDSDDPANQQRDGFFPTQKVVDGFDYLGEDPDNFVADDDPIDILGHGTAVASVVLSVAPNVQLVAMKVCNMQECPDWAIIDAIERLLDPNSDGNVEDRVDVINLSAGRAFGSAYYDVVAFSLEFANFFGAVVVTSVGNVGNVPYSVDATGGTPNAISVAATNVGDPVRYMEPYSSRGPGDGNWLKPDLAAPGVAEVATAASGTLTGRASGTSFSSPLVAGAAVLLKQKCPECSPFAIRAILMNNAERSVGYSRENTATRAPISRMGSGEVRIDRAMDASFWAYSLADFQPTLGIGMVDAHVNLRYTRQLVIFSLSSEPQTLRMSSEFRSQAQRDSGAVEINFDWEEAVLGGCNEQNNAIVVTVEFLVYSERAPVNRLTTSGTRGYDPEMMDIHEFGGHIVIASDEREIALPFHMILRQAAAPIMGKTTFLPNRGAVDTNFTIFNNGTGIAQIDAFEMIYSDVDEPEPDYGAEGAIADIRTIGYRTVPVGEPGCDYLVEFNFQTWERVRHVGMHTIRASIFLERDGAPVTMWIPPIPAYSETYIMDEGGNNRCTGLSSDHSSNTANTIMRACSNDLGLEGNTTFYARFQTNTYPLSKSVSWVSGLVRADFPTPTLRASSYDIRPGETFEAVTVTGEIDENSYGIQFVTNSFRNFDHTGAATPETETLNVFKQGIIPEPEVTPDVFIWPGDENRVGPECSIWSIPTSSTCSPTANTRTAQSGDATILGSSITEDIVPLQGGVMFPEENPACPPIVVPRVQVPTNPPSQYPSSRPTSPTTEPSAFPSFKPRVFLNPTAEPRTDLPSATPTTLPPVSGAPSTLRFGCVTFAWVLFLAGATFGW